ncbi:MAG: hypothetical protein EP341_03220 [Sphingomonadales bacterium]|nr:MAG: hypothetical protein EP341_03220 [Sphingomonadales bacterium]
MFTNQDQRNECFDHGARIGAILSMTLAAMDCEFGPADRDEIILLAEAITESLWDRLEVSETHYDEVERGLQYGCDAYADVKAQRVAA